MQIFYEKDLGDGYKFIFASKQDPGIGQDKYEELAKDMYDLARGYGACTSVMTLYDADDNVVSVFGVVCSDCDPNNVDSESERLLCNLARG